VRYDKAYERLANRAIKQTAVDIQAFMQMAADSNISQDRLEEMMLDDLESGGPIFGKFIRSLSAAASSATQAASRQGAVLASIDESMLTETLTLADVADAAMDADPEVIEEITSQTIQSEPMTWVATMVNTCARCLPLHGKTKTMTEWDELGLNPDTIHEGWDSDCQCNLIPAKEFGKNADLVAPLLRKKIVSPTGQKPTKRTVRAVLQEDVDKARDAVAKAMETERGRRTLSLLGKANAPIGGVNE